MSVNIGMRRELFIDDWLIETMSGVRLQLQKPQRQEIALNLDAPWEDCGAFPVSVFPWDGGWRLYYNSHWGGNSAALAESQDGITFTRPQLGLCEFQGSKRNNLLISPETVCDPSPFIDINPACRPEQRFKSLTHHDDLRAYVMTSSDGLHWSLLQKAPLELTGNFDTINTAFWDSLAGCYRCYTRSWHDLKTGRVMELGRDWYRPKDAWLLRSDAEPIRAIQHATSPDFIHWSAPEQLQYADGNMATHLYTNGIVPCPGAEHIYLGFPNRFVPERNPDPEHPEPGVNDALFMASHDGVHWTRWLDAWVDPGPDPLNWTERNNYPVWGIAETSPTEWSMYISDRRGHKGVVTCIRRLPIRPWGFVSVNAEYVGGELLTKPFTFSGSVLYLNARTSAVGSIQVEVQEENGHPVPGFTLEQMTPWFGDAIDAPMVWKRGKDVSRLADRPVRLRFVMRDADLFALRFA